MREGSAILWLRSEESRIRKAGCCSWEPSEAIRGDRQLQGSPREDSCLSRRISSETRFEHQCFDACPRSSKVYLLPPPHYASAMILDQFLSKTSRVLCDNR